MIFRRDIYPSPCWHSTAQPQQLRMPYSLSPLTAEILCSPEKDSLVQEQEMSRSRRRSQSASASHREGRQPGLLSPGDSGSYLGWTRG